MRVVLDQLPLRFDPHRRASEHWGLAKCVTVDTASRGKRCWLTPI
jgi:hypothetical protein